MDTNTANLLLTSDKAHDDFLKPLFLENHMKIRLSSSMEVCMSLSPFSCGISNNLWVRGVGIYDSSRTERCQRLTVEEMVLLIYLEKEKSDEYLGTCENSSWLNHVQRHEPPRTTQSFLASWRACAQMNILQHDVDCEGLQTWLTWWKEGLLSVEQYRQHWRRMCHVNNISRHDIHPWHVDQMSKHEESQSSLSIFNKKIRQFRRLPFKIREVGRLDYRKDFYFCSSWYWCLRLSARKVQWAVNSLRLVFKAWIRGRCVRG